MTTMTEERIAPREVKDLPALLQFRVGTPVRVNYNNRDDWMLYWGQKDNSGAVQFLPDSTIPRRQNNSALPVLLVETNDIQFVKGTLSFANIIKETYEDSHPEYSDRKSALEASGLLLK